MLFVHEYCAVCAISSAHVETLSRIIKKEWSVGLETDSSLVFAPHENQNSSGSKTIKKKIHSQFFCLFFSWLKQLLQLAEHLYCLRKKFLQHLLFFVTKWMHDQTTEKSWETFQEFLEKITSEKGIIARQTGWFCFLSLFSDAKSTKRQGRLPFFYKREAFLAKFYTLMDTHYYVF